MYNPNKFSNTAYLPTSTNPNRSLAHTAPVDAPMNLARGPRRTLRSKPRSRLAPASMHVTSGTALVNLDPPRMPSMPDGPAIDNTAGPIVVPATSRLNRSGKSALDFLTAELHGSSMAFDLDAEKAYGQNVVSANVITQSMRMAVDPTYGGFGPINSGANRVAYKNEPFMNRQRRVRERTELCPYTGRKVDYYRTAAPEGNTDRRITQDQLKYQNPRLRLMQGYDSTRPKPRRREVRQSLPEPDNVFGDAAIQARIRGEITERVGRQIMLNRNGESVPTVKDTGQPFGFNGYHNMLRFIPYVPPTMRADTRSLMPAVDQMMNPDPGREAAVVRGRQTRKGTKRVEKVDWRAPADGTHNQAATLRNGINHAPRAVRDEYSRDGPKQGPGSLATSGGAGDVGDLVVGRHRPSNRKLPDQVDPELRGAVASLSGASGAGEFSTTAVLRRHMDRRTKTNRTDTVGVLLSGLSPLQPDMHSARRVDRTDARTAQTKREGARGAVPLDLMTNYSELNSTARIHGEQSREGHRMEGQAGFAHAGYAQDDMTVSHRRIEATRVNRGTRRHDTLGVISVPELVQIMMPERPSTRGGEHHAARSQRGQDADGRVPARRAGQAEYNERPTRISAESDLMATKRDGQRHAVHTGHTTALQYGESQARVQSVREKNGQNRKLADVKGAVASGHGTWHNPVNKPGKISYEYDHETKRAGAKGATASGHGTWQDPENKPGKISYEYDHETKRAGAKGATASGRGTWQNPENKPGKISYEYDHETRRADQPGAAPSGRTSMRQLESTAKLQVEDDRRQNTKKSAKGAVKTGHSVRGGPDLAQSAVPGAYQEQKDRRPTMRAQTPKGPMPERDVTIDAQAFRGGKHDKVDTKSEAITRKAGAIVNRLGAGGQSTNDRVGSARDKVVPRREQDDAREFKAKQSGTIVAYGGRPSQTRGLAKRGAADQARALNFGHGGVVAGTGDSASPAVNALSRVRAQAYVSNKDRTRRSDAAALMFRS